ncbi:hypothetical protein ACLOJK_010291 [Asimina triloba]
MAARSRGLSREGVVSLSITILLWKEWFPQSLHRSVPGNLIKGEAEDQHLESSSGRVQTAFTSPGSWEAPPAIWPNRLFLQLRHRISFSSLSEVS